nr:hypothetical protein [Gemmatimonadaceae bacterium]
RAGGWMYRRVRGEDDSIVSPRDTQKQVSREETFASDLHDDALIERELLRLAVRVSADLRKQSLRARTITVKLRDADFRTRSAQRTLRLPIASERSVLAVAKALLAQLRGRRRVGARLIGIGLSHFDEVAPVPTQLALFEAPPATPDDEPVDDARELALTKALDRIRNRFGAESIVPARLLDPASDVGPRVEE